MIYATLTVLVFLIGVIPFIKYYKEEEERELRSPVDLDFYILHINLWLILSILFPFTLVAILIIYLCKSNFCKE